MPDTEDRSQWLPSDWIRQGWAQNLSYVDDDDMQMFYEDMAANPKAVSKVCILGGIDCTRLFGDYDDDKIDDFVNHLESLLRPCFDGYGIAVSNDDYIKSQDEAVAFTLAAEEMAGLR